MRKRITICLSLIILIALSSIAHAKSPVWKITKGENHLFIGGTFHVLSQADYPLPDAFETAYQNSILLILETNTQEIQKPEIQAVLRRNGVYEGNQDITQFLTPGTLNTLNTFLAERGIPLDNIRKLKPGILSLTLTVVELQRLGQAGTGVDEFYSLKALNDKRNINYLETALDQVNFITDMGIGYEEDFIRYTLRDLNDLPNLLQSLKKAWKDGDNLKMKEIALMPWKERFPEIYRSLLVERNNNWIPQIEKMMATKEIELILFGALHLVGEDGILFQLERLGYTIENIN